jgi:hypothetical protein
MTAWFVVLVIIGGIVAIYVSYKIPTGPSICPNCNKEYKELEHWSYGEYLWGARCPHCKYEFDITP